MDAQSVIKMMVLNTVKIFGVAPYPANDNWGYLHEILEELELEGLLRIDDNEAFYSLTRDGIKTIKLFEGLSNEQRIALKPYEEVLVDNRFIDARVPLVSFSNRYKLTPKHSHEHLLTIGLFLYWDQLLHQIIEMEKAQENWQELVATGIIFQRIEEIANPNAWQVLGRNIQDAERTATFLIDPAQAQTGLVQISRQIQ